MSFLRRRRPSIWEHYDTFLRGLRKYNTEILDLKRKERETQREITRQREVINPRRTTRLPMQLQKRLQKYRKMIQKKEAQRHAWQDRYAEIVNYVGTYTHLNTINAAQRANWAARQATRSAPPPPPSTRSVLPNGPLAFFDPNKPNHIRLFRGPNINNNKKR
jgi:chromosome segregation ATPase